MSVLRVVAKSLIGLSLGIVLSTVVLITLNLDIMDKSTSFVVSKLVQDVAIFGSLLVLFYRRSFKKILTQLLHANSNKSYIPSVITLLILLAITTTVFIFLYLWFGYDDTQSKVLQEYYNQDITIEYLKGSFFVFLFYLVGAFFEEFIFRFIMFRHLRRHGLLLALLISSVLFSLMHGNIGIPFSFVFGVAIALHYEITNNFFRSVAIHALHNYLSVYYASYIAYLLFK